jgi:uncharacterized membrane protein YhiD involved in acid resistance
MFDLELINFNPEAPSFLVMLITALLAFFLSSLIAITYEFTTKSIYKRAHFLQSLALIGVVASTILQAIGESVAIGLGIIGALSIIRFRTSLNDPRNITFMFASLGVGIACGVMGFTIALTGTLVFCLGAIILRFSPLSNTDEIIGTLRLRVPKDDQLQKIIEKQLKKVCRDFELDRIRFISPKRANPALEGEMPEEVEFEQEKIQEFTYLIRLKDSVTISILEEKLTAINGLEDMRVGFQNQTTKL